LATVLFLLLIVQSILAYTGIQLLSGLHGVNALVMIALGGYLTGSNWAFRRSVQSRPLIGASVTNQPK
jgi:hypothetical protein